MPAARYPLESLFGRILSPFDRFLHRTTAGGIVLIGATVLALVLAAWLGDEAVHHFWDQPFELSLGGLALELTLHHAVNDGLMALFFLLVGLELKREILIGELSSLRDAALPVVAAAGGMAVPALLYLALNAGGPGAAGWGVPMATDIAFAVGILVLLGSRVPRNLIIFLTALAIADDLGAVLVIALFYAGEINQRALGAAGLVALLLVLFNRGGVRNPLPYAVAGFFLWLFMLRSGVHATIAGVVLAFSIPTRPACTPADFEARLSEMLEGLRRDRLDAATADDPLRNRGMASLAEAVEHAGRAVQSPLQRMEHALAPWMGFVVVPIFALANAGIDLTTINWEGAFARPVTLGVMLGLVAGKFLGISAFCWLAVKTGLGRLPRGVRWGHMMGAAWLAGIGFTMSLFIAQLAFGDPALVEEAKLGILLASGVSATLGVTWLLLVKRE